MDQESDGTDQADVESHELNQANAANAGLDLRIIPPALELSIEFGRRDGDVLEEAQHINESVDVDVFVVMLCDELSDTDDVGRARRVEAKCAA